MADRKIKGKSYQVGAVLATEAVRLQARLLKVIGAGIERLPVILAGVGEASAEAKSASNAAAIAAFTDIFGQSDPDEITSLVGDIVALATVKRPSGSWEQVDLDGDFTEDKSALIPVTLFVLQETFGDFFTGVLENGDKIKKVMG